MYPFSFRWNKKHEDFCVKNNIFLKHALRIKSVYKKRNLFLFSYGDKIEIISEILVEPYATMPLRSFCSMGMHSYSASYLPNNFVVGRYCSIAPNVKVMGTQHPLDRFTTSPLTYDSRFIKIARDEYNSSYDITPYIKELPAPTIGNDVWIGENATLKGGINIGDGAVIAANSVVTKDIPPYAVVAGVPARIIKYRFSDVIRAELLAMKWWEYDFVTLPGSSSPIEEFIEHFHRKQQSGELRLARIKKINLSQEFYRLR